MIPILVIAVPILLAGVFSPDDRISAAEPPTSISRIAERHATEDAEIDSTQDPLERVDLHAEPRGHCGCRYPVLAGTGFGNNACLSHTLGKQELTKAIVDFVRPCMIELVTFEINFGAASMLA